jgi:glycosyltransferase involved in cell wall biosynthesis
MNKISAVVLTHNNEDTISKCLDSLDGVVDEVIIIDDNSTDSTLKILKDMNCRIYRRTLDDFSSQRNYGISKASFDWIMTIDSDEYLDDDLINSLKALKRRHLLIDCYLAQRFNRNFYGGTTCLLTRRPLLMRSRYRFKGKLHEAVDYKSSEVLDGQIVHDCWKNLSDFVRDIDEYSTKKAATWIEENRSYGLPYLMFRQFVAFNFQIFYRLFIELRIFSGWKAIMYCFFWASEEVLVGLKYLEMREKK